jgi:YwiC-like protein
MMAANQLKELTGSVRLRPVALPVEHGGWGLLLEPIVLGLLLAPSLSGVFLSIAAVGAFLARHPLKLTVGDWRRKRRTARTVMAERFAVLYACAAALAFAAALKSANSSFMLPLVIAAPIAALQLVCDSMGRSRALVAELAGSLATGAVATAIAISGGWPRALAFALWVILAARSAPTILYLRARLRLLHQRSASPGVAIVAHLAAILMVTLLARAQIVPWLAVAAVVLLLVRAIIGFVGTGKQVTARKLGLRELEFGAITVLAVVIGYRIGW